METICRENPLVVLPALLSLRPEKCGRDAGGKQHPSPGCLLGGRRRLQMVSRVPLPMQLPRGHLLEPAAHSKTALAGGAAQGKVLFGYSFHQSDEGVQGALLFEGGEGVVGVNSLKYDDAIRMENII